MSSEAPAAAPAIDRSRLPDHLAMIMDGNGRWARKRLFNRVRGHERGMEVVRTVVRTCRELKIPYLTLYAFSTENWARPQAEVSALMALLRKFLTGERPEMMDNQIRLSAIGEIDRLPAEVRRDLDKTLALTADNTGMVLNLALSYGGRAEIVQMARSLARRAADGTLDPDAITAETVADHLYTAGMPDPDILIRTSGEMRISNFLLWQIAYAEIFITPTLWPDFTREELLEILDAFSRRERRFGKV